jgi:hypothetical protein
LLFYQTPPPLPHAHVLCRSPIWSYLSFPNGSTLSLANTKIYKSLFCTKLGHLHIVNLWASLITLLQRNMLPPTGSLLAQKMQAACSFKIFVSNNTNIRFYNPRHCQCETLKRSFQHSQKCKTLNQWKMSYKVRYNGHSITKLPYIINS